MKVSKKKINYLFQKKEFLQKMEQTEKVKQAIIEVDEELDRLLEINR